MPSSSPKSCPVTIVHDNGTLKTVQNPLAKLHWVITEARQAVLHSTESSLKSMWSCFQRAVLHSK